MADIAFIIAQTFREREVSFSRKRERREMEEPQGCDILKSHGW